MGKQKIVVLGTGGTIAGRSIAPGDDAAYSAGQVAVDVLLTGICAPAGMGLLAEQVAQVDSKDMDFALWLRLAQRVRHWLAQPDVQGIVITHGTDTLEETAYFLHAALQPTKPVVLTGAMRPATSLQPDGPQNLQDAITVAADPAAAGVLTVFSGRVMAAVDVQKTHSTRPDAFSSGDAGDLAQMRQNRVHWERNIPPALMQNKESAIENVANTADSADWPWVEVLMSYAGARGDTVNALVAQGVRGLVVAATGTGTLHHALEAALLQAQHAGVVVWRASRCANGGVRARPGDRIPTAGGLSPAKARIALMLALMVRG